MFYQEVRYTVSVFPNIATMVRVIGNFTARRLHIHSHQQSALEAKWNKKAVLG